MRVRRELRRTRAWGGTRLGPAPRVVHFRAVAEGFEPSEELPPHSLSRSVLAGRARSDAVQRRPDLLPRFRPAGRRPRLNRRGPHRTETETETASYAFWSRSNGLKHEGCGLRARIRHGRRVTLLALWSLPRSNVVPFCFAVAASECRMCSLVGDQQGDHGHDARHHCR